MLDAKWIKLRHEHSLRLHCPPLWMSLTAPRDPVEVLLDSCPYPVRRRSSTRYELCKSLPLWQSFSSVLLTLSTRNGSSEFTVIRDTGFSGIVVVVVLRQANAVTKASNAMSNQLRFQLQAKMKSTCARSQLRLATATPLSDCQVSELATHTIATTTNDSINTSNATNTTNCSCIDCLAYPFAMRRVQLNANAKLAANRWPLPQLPQLPSYRTLNVSSV